MYTATFDFSSVDAITRDIDNLESTFESSMLDTAIDIEQTYIPQLAQYPPNRAKHPFQFATPKSRRYYFHLVNTGQVNTDSYGYVRSGRYGQSWNVDVSQSGNEYIITVENTFPAAIYVGGSRQVGGHANTGWILYQPILDQIDEFASRQFFETISEKFN